MSPLVLNLAMQLARLMKKSGLNPVEVKVALDKSLEFYDDRKSVRRLRTK